MIDIGNLNERIQFCENTNTGDDGLPTRPTVRVLYECWGKLEEMKQADIMTALNQQTKVTVSFLIRDSSKEYEPSNHHFIRHREKEYQIKYVKSNFSNTGFTSVYCEVVS